MFSGKRIDELKERIVEQEKAISSLKEEFNSQAKLLEKTNSLLNEIIQKFDEFKKREELRIGLLEKEIAEIEKRRKEFEGAVTNFNSLRNRIEEMVCEKILEVVNKEISSINAKTKKFESVEEDFAKLWNQVLLLEKQISKFNNIAANIKEVDFTLKRYMKEIELNDKEKLRLMKEIDTLKSIIAKMRRMQR